MSDNSKPNIPKFASFRPKVQPFAKETSPLRKEKSLKDDRNDERSHDHRRSKSQERGHKHRDRRDRSRERGHHNRVKEPSTRELTRVIAPEPVFVDDDGPELFIVDRKGDFGNLTYGRLHKYNIPTYRRSGYGSVLGLEPRLKIDRELSNEKDIVLRVAGRSDRQTRRLLAKPSSRDNHRLRLIRPTDEDRLLEHDQDFILLQPSRKRKRGSQSPISENGEQDYRSIEGKAKTSKEPLDADLEYLTDSSDAAAAEDEAEISARKKNGELTRMSSDQPRNLSVWLELIQHQAALFGGATSGVHALSSLEQRNLADIRISIYEKALQNIGNDLDSRATLWVGLLKQGGLIWESKKQASKWQEALQAHPSALNLWVAYLDFIQTSATEFRYESCKTEYIKCLDILAKAGDTRRKNSKAEQDRILEVFVYLLLRVTVFMRESGYHEHSEALWQATLEMRYLAPRELGVTTTESNFLSSFEEFWESEVARIGEANAKGWSYFSADKEDFQDPIVTELETVENAEDVFKAFAVAERTMAGRLSHPGRSADEAGEDDPYHIIFFNDIKPFFIPELLCDVSQTDIINAFLCYLGLPGLAWSINRRHETWWVDAFLRRQTTDAPSGFRPLKCSQITSEVLFSDAFDDIQLSDSLWIRRALRNLCDATKDEVLAEYIIAFELHYFPESAAKTAKSLIKANRSSLRLYNSYGIVESRTSRTESADRVFATAIGMSASLGDEKRKFSVLLWRTWIREAIRIGSLEKVIHRLLSIGESDPSFELSSPASIEFSPSAILKVSRWLTEGRDDMLSTGDHHLAAIHTELLALLAYFRHERSIEHALTAYQESFALFDGRNLTDSPACEHLHQSRIQLLDMHLSHTKAFKPSLIRDCLSESIKIFPNNTIFLTAYAENEARFRIDDRVRSLMTDVVLSSTQETIIGWSFAIWSERQRGLEFGGTVHAVRAMFEKAVESTVGKHSIALWVAYFYFESERGQGKRAKDVFLRGLRCLPWSKWFLVGGFEALDGLSFEEERALWGVFGERELRVHVDVDDVLQEIAEERKQVGLKR